MRDYTPYMQLLFAKGMGTVALNRIFGRIKKHSLSIDEFAGLPVGVLTSDFELSHDAAVSIGENYDEASAINDKLYEHNVEVLVNGQDRYPVRLSSILDMQAPPFLFAHGDLDIIEKPSVGFCGARNASEDGLRFAQETAAILASKGVNIVSGYARGVDLATHYTALEANGLTTVVLAEGIFHFQIKNEIKPVMQEDALLVLSEYPPGLPWMSHNAMRRNKLICALSNAVVLIEAGKTGGTFAAGKTAMELQRPLFVVEYDGHVESAAGNLYFLQRAAFPLRRNSDGEPGVESILNALEQEKTAQAALDL